MRVEDWKTVLARQLKTARVFAVHCWQDEKEAISLALPYGKEQPSKWETGKIIAGPVTEAFCQMLLSQPRPAPTHMGERNTPFFTIALDNGFWSEHYGRELNDGKKTVLCWGDSNTYGFDPRGFWGGRYDPENRWCDILAGETGWNVVNCGENGRTLPRHSWELDSLERTLLEEAPVPVLAVMLGTNDVLMDGSTPLSHLTGAMEELLDRVGDRFPETTVLLLGPPAVRVGVQPLEEKLRELSGAYAELARKRRLYFCDAGAWDLPLAHDGVHLSEAGHRAFARHLLDWISEQKITL